MFKNLKKRAKAMEETLNGITDTLIAANKTASAATRLVKMLKSEKLTSMDIFRHTSQGGTEPDDLTLVDATFSSTQCGAFVRHNSIFQYRHEILQTLTSWSTTLNYFSATGAADAADPFNGGTFTPQINGWYHICSFARFRNTGNSNDVTVMVVSVVSYL